MNASDILKYGHQTVMQTLESFPVELREKPGACGVWSVKDLLAHLTSYEQVLVDILSTFSNGGGTTPYLTKFLETQPHFNNDEVNLRKEKTPGEILNEYQDAHARTLSLISEISPETLRQSGTLPWYGMEYALDDLLVYQYYGHKREHSAQIAAFADRLKNTTV